MYLFTVILPLAIQASMAHAVPPGLSPKVEYQRDVGHGSSLTADAVHATPTVGIHNRDLASGKLKVALFYKNIS